jgi:hypothetical protein
VALTWQARWHTWPFTLTTTYHNGNLVQQRSEGSVVHRTNTIGVRCATLLCSFCPTIVTAIWAFGGHKYTSTQHNEDTRATPNSHPILATIPSTPTPPKRQIHQHRARDFVVPCGMTLLRVLHLFLCSWAFFLLFSFARLEREMWYKGHFYLFRWLSVQHTIWN